MSKSINGHYIYSDTKMKPFKMGESLGLAFDFGKRDMTGFLVSDSETALGLASYFTRMAKALAKLEKAKKP